MISIGIDTSNYTTSIASFNGTSGTNCSCVLPVKQGELGLRQSDAVFSHIKGLPELSGRLFSNICPEEIGAIGVSTQPRACEGSYMPCFLVGYSHAAMLSKLLGKPLVQVSHQQGHIAAVLWNAGRQDLLDEPHLAWHLSGGTTELLYVIPDGTRNLLCSRIGGTSDISAGQLIDRVGQLLGLPFPSGRYLDNLSSQVSCPISSFHVKCRDSQFSLSGVQNKVQLFYAESASPEETACYTLSSIIYAVKIATEQALTKFPGLPVVFSGGVSANSALRASLSSYNVVFANPGFSTDNAMGVAVLAHRIAGVK